MMTLRRSWINLVADRLMYCLSPKVYELDSSAEIIINPASRDWETELIGKHNHNQQQRRRGLTSRIIGHPYTEEEISAEAVHQHPDVDAHEHLEHHEDLADRVDHYTQLLPENFINTDDEITYLSASDDEGKDSVVGPWADIHEIYPKYL